MSKEQHLHHISKRKRAHTQGLKEYPHKNRWVRFLDKFLLILAVVSPLTTLPQIIKIYGMKSAIGVSSFTWFAYCLAGIPWLFYGIVHKDKPITISSIMWFIVNLTVAIGAVLY